MPRLHFDLKDKIVARNVHEENDDHQQHDDVPHKDHSHEKHDNEDDKREDCEEGWKHCSYNYEDQEWGFRIEYMILKQLVSEDKIKVAIPLFEIFCVFYCSLLNI